MRSTSPNPLACSLLLTFGLATQASAQIGLPLAVGLQKRGANQQISQGSAIITRFAALDLFENDALDGAVLFGGYAYALYAPEDHGGLFALAPDALDLAPLTGGGEEGRDALVVAHSTGLGRYWYDDTAGALASVTFLPTHSFQRLFSADLDGDGTPELVALDGDQRSFWRIDGPAQASPQATLLFTGTADVFDFVVLQWNASGSPSIAALTTSGIEVRSLTGTDDHPTQTFTTTGGALCALPTVLANERLAVVYTDAQETRLVVGDASGFETPQAAGSGSEDLGPVAAAAGEFTGDANADLALAVTATQELLVFPNVSAGTGTPTFGPYIEIDVAPDEPCPANQTNPVVADWDRDGDDDVLYPLQNTLQLAHAEGTTQDANLQELVLTSGDYHVSARGGPDRVELTFGLPASSGAFDRVKVVVWKAEDATSQVENVVYFSDDTLTWAPGAQVVDVTFFPDVPLGAETVYYIELWLADLTGTEWTALAPASGWALSSGVLSLQTLEQLNGPGVGVVVHGSNDSRVGVAVTTTTFIPDFLNDSIPDPWQ